MASKSTQRKRGNEDKGGVAKPAKLQRADVEDTPTADAMGPEVDPSFGGDSIRAAARLSTIVDELRPEVRYAAVRLLFIGLRDVPRIKRANPQPKAQDPRPKDKVLIGLQADLDLVRAHIRKAVAESGEKLKEDHPLLAEQKAVIAAINDHKRA